jgi:PAS domain S-box-containing protein
MRSRRRSTDRQPILELKNLSLNFNTLSALKDINLAVGQSEAHAIVGEHGAGKSSLCHIISGFLRQSSGTILIDGHLCDNISPKRAHQFGIELVTQQNPLFENLTIIDNLIIDNRGFSQSPFVSKSKLRARAVELLKRYDFNLDPDEVVKNLKLADRVLLDILKHIANRPRLLILDEALQKLSAVNLSKIIAILSRLKSSGASIIFVTHRIDDIYHFADKVTILKNGETLITDSVNNIDKINLIRLAYTQLNTSESLENANQEFYQLLKYNEAMLQKLPVNLIVVDRENRIKLINEKAKEYFDIGDSNYLNTMMDRLLTDPNRGVLNLIEEGLKQRQDSVYYNVPLLRKNGTAHTNIRIHPLYDETFLIGHNVVIEDITEQEKLREQVVLSEKLASVGLLSAGVAHEINNPLEIIANDIEYIKLKVTHPEVLETLHELEGEFHSISQIVNDLVTFSDSNRSFIEIVDINELIAGILNLVKHSANHRNITMHFERMEEPLEVHINRTEIKQVILNLIKNSFEAMPEGGDLIVRTTESRTDDTGQAEITVQDTGCGIPAQDVKDIFVPFYSTKRGNNMNMGLGLSVSYGIISKYKGSISVKNLGGAGCQFTIVLPSRVTET